MNFRSADYKDYNKRLGLYKYAYLHKLLDILYKLRERYNLIDERLFYWSDEDEKQAEVLSIMYFDVNERIIVHQQIFKDLWSKRHSHIIKQLRLF